MRQASRFAASLLTCLLLLCSHAVWAATYTLPADFGSSPFGSCTWNAGTSTATCSGNLAIGSNNTVNFTGSMTLQVSGDFTVSNNSTLNSNGYSVTVIAGDDIVIGNSFVGSINFEAVDDFSAGNSATISGNITAGDDITIDNSATVSGNITAGDDIQIGTNATIAGNISAADTLNIGGGSTVSGSCTPGHPLCSGGSGTGLIAEYRFDECYWSSGSAGEVIDSVGAYHGTPYNVTTAQGGVVYRAADLSASGTSDYIRWPNTLLNGRTDFTISLWFRTAVSQAQQEILHGLGSSTSDDEIEIYLINANRIRVNLFDNGNDYTVPTAFTDNAWHHLAVTRSGNSVCVYVDATSLGCNNRGNGALSITNANALLTGQEQDAYGGSFAANQSLRAQLDEFKVFSSALTALQIVGVRNNELAGNNWDGTMRVPACAPVAEYRFDECSQYSGGAGQVQDSAGSYPGRPMGGLQNAASGQIHRLADFSNARRYAEVPSGPALTDWTISVWFRMPFDTANHSSRYYVLGSVSSRGDFLYLDRNSGGGAYRWGVYDHNGGTTDGSFRFGTLANGWHHMVLVGSGATTALYIDGTYRDQVTRKTQGTFNYLGASVDNRGTGSGQSFGTPLDEFKVFALPLVAGVITEIYSNELSGNNWDGSMRSNPCVALDHIRIEHDGEGLTCMPETVTVRACADAACSSEYTSGSVTTTLSPTGWVGGDTITFTGNTTKSLAKTITGPATLDAASTTPAPTSGTRCFNSATETCAMNFVDAGFIFSAAADGTEASIATQTAGTAFGPWWLRAVKTGTTSKACEAAITSPQTVSFNYVCVDPATCSSGSNMTVGASTVGSAATAVSLIFDANGNASLGSIVYQDVGRITLAASATVGSATLTGSLTGPGGSPFVVKPDHFDLSAITCSDATVNPAAADASGARFCKAGDDFNVSITARSSTGSATKNYGNESSAESAKLSRVLAGGLGLTQPGVLTGGFGAFADGVASGNFQWDEVGIITLMPSIGDGDYLGGGDVSSAASGNVGRFYPHHFDTVVTDACPGGGFTYSGQPFPLMVVAENLGGGITGNYSGSFARTITFADANSAAGAFSPATLAAGDFASGIADFSVTPSVSFAFTNKLATPATLRVRASDGEATSADGAEGTTHLRSGRLRLSNAFGPATGSLAVPVQAHYWSGSAWVINGDDSCTSLAANAFYPTGPLAATTSASAVSLAGGQGTLTLTNTGATGSIDVAANLGTSGVDQSCLSSHGGTAANLPWLRSQNGSCAATYDRDPAARATFGVYAPETRKSIHVQELF